MAYLDNIHSPADLKKLTISQMKEVASEIRKAVLNRDSLVGGHVGPNLGIVETTLALHVVFDSPTDKIVWDVSHQSYPHKILTGRANGFLTPEGMQHISGYTNPDESDHDFFKVGHTSTSVSLACGLAKARDLKGQTHDVIAVIGDGSLSGGEALEGLSNAAVSGSGIIVIVNDNEMSIAENHGGIYTNLRLLRETNGEAACNMFKAFGFDYHYVADGHDLEAMIRTLQAVKGTQKPVVIHVHTQKGKGYAPAETHREAWHWRVPFHLTDGTPKEQMSGENYNDITYAYLSDKIKKDKTVVAVNAGTPGVFGLDVDRRVALGAHFVDVGIAEEHAVAFSSALAKGGCKPIFFVMSSFVQRTYDQLLHDLAINRNPAVIVVAWGGISGADVTHLCTFDIPLISNIPNIVYLAPTTVEEYVAMLDWAVDQKEHPVVIRMPRSVIHEKTAVEKDYSSLNTYRVMQSGTQVALIAAGSFFELGRQVAGELEKQGVIPTLINPRYLTGVDEVLLTALKEKHQVIATLEDGVVAGGFGEKITRFYGADPMKVLNFGAKKEFTDRVAVETLYQRYHLTPELIAADILTALHSK